MTGCRTVNASCEIEGQNFTLDLYSELFKIDAGADASDYLPGHQQILRSMYSAV